MTEAERQAQIRQAQHLIGARLQHSAPPPPKRLFTHQWFEFEPGVFSLILHVDGSTKTEIFTEADLLDGSGSEEGGQWLLAKLEAFLQRAFGAAP